MNSGNIPKKSLMLSSLALGLLLAGCAGEGMPTPAGAVALSEHYVQVTFGASAGPEAEIPSNYAISVAGQGPLTIFAADLSFDGTQVILTTSSQDAVPYELAVNGTGQRLAFNGSNEPEPGLLSATSLSNTSVLLTFSDRMDADSIGNPLFYEIADPDGDTDIDIRVTAASLGDEDEQVLLTTTPQDNIEYFIRVTNVTQAAGGKLIDPNRSTASFFGIPPVDTTGPTLVSAVSTNDTTLILTFSEPLDNESADPALFSITPELVVTNAIQTFYDTQIVLTTLPQTVEVVYTVSVSGVHDKSANGINSAGDSAAFTFPGAALLVGSETLPRVVGATSTSNTTVVVTYNKAMGDSVVNDVNYTIAQKNVNPEAGGLAVMDARFIAADRTAVELTTVSQNEVTYVVTAVNVQDQQGNQLAFSSALGDAASAVFSGTPPGGPGIDSDGDGLPDNQEQRGWVVTVVMGNGSINLRDVTSDPFRADTDEDGVPDNAEKGSGSDPRDADTDDDGLPDNEERLTWQSSLTHQDTDGDGIGDAGESLDYKISSILADTDGDGLEDGYEVIFANRDPRIADLPRPLFDIGDIAMRLDSRFSFTDTLGMSRNEIESVNTSVSQSETDTFGFSDSSTTTNSIEVSAELGGEYGSTGWKVSGKAGFKYGWTGSETHTYDTRNTTQAQETYQESLTTSQTVDQTQSVTREVVGANMQLSLTIRNEGDIAFSLSNVEISALQQDIRDRGRFVPVATLKADDPEVTFNLGPLVPEKGPFIFDSDEIFPSLVEDLLKNPRGLVFNIANFDMEDEFGRNFAFTSQDVNDRTAGLVFDYGNGTTDTFRVATSSSFDPQTGEPLGITMAYALQDIIGLEKNPDPASPDAIVDGGNRLGDTVAAGDDDQVVQPGKLVGPDGIVIRPGPNGVIDTVAGGDDESAVTRGYTTELDEDGIERIVRVRTSKNIPEEQRFWTVFTNTEADATVNFDDIVLHGGDIYSLAFVQDKDGDSLIAREEFLYGSSDLTPNTDGLVIKDGSNGLAETTAAGDDIQLQPPGFEVPLFTALIAPGPNGVLDTVPGGDDIALSAADSDTLDDLCEVRQGWTIQVVDQVAYRGYSDPARPDSDADMLLDHEEFAAATDARKRDTDDDTLIDFDEVFDVIFGGANGVAETVALGDDIQVVPDGNQTGPDNVVVRPGPDKILQSLPAGDDASYAGLDPLNADTDVDGLNDGLEIRLGANPIDPSDAARYRDTDNDGLTDFEEQDQGWEVHVTGATVYLCSNNGQPCEFDYDCSPGDEEPGGTCDPVVVDTIETVYSNPFEPDSDFDGLPDLLEMMVASHPRETDTDSDGLPDYDEFDPNSRSSIDPVLFNDFEDRCFEADRCDYEYPESTSSTTPYGTGLDRVDTDDDGRNDFDEIFEGWVVLACVMGTPELPLLVYSDPTVADADNDNLLDGEEEALLTHPFNADTDGDTVFDGSDPIPDGCSKIVRIEFLSYSVGTDPCDGFFCFDDADIDISLSVEFDGNEYTPVDVGCTYLSAGEVLNFAFNSTTVSLKPGDRFNISGLIRDLDGTLSCELCGSFPHESWTVLPREWTFADVPSGLVTLTPESGEISDPCMNDGGDQLQIRFTVTE